MSNSSLPAAAPLRVEFKSQAGIGFASLGHARPGGLLEVPLPALFGGPAYECWLPGAVTAQVADRYEGFTIVRDADWLFAGIAVDDGGDALQLERLTEQLYRRIPDLGPALGYPQPVKIWHYLAGINEGEGDAERYRHFCIGRAHGIGDRGWLAAATAVGAPQPAPLTIYLLASRHPVRLLENPRQVPAFRYPRAYGPRSPSFARAAWVAASGQLFVSGTAAVVGHESRHPHDAVAQLGEIAANLAALVERAEQEAGLAAGSLRAEALKIYVRRAEDDAPLQAAARQWLPECPAIWLRGDISRADLLVEVEALYAR